MAKRWIALFPGQGSQQVGMAKTLFQDFAVVRETFEEASEAVKKDLRKLCFDGPESDLTLTENTQPCLLTASVAAFRAVQSTMEFKPSIVAGHSLGEYSALVAAGALPLPTAAAWVRERGAAMQRAVPAGEGTMAAIMGLGDDTVAALCVRATEEAQKKRGSPDTEDLTVDAIVQPANFNSPGQVVIAGARDAVAEAVALVKLGVEFPGGKAIPLAVSAPFHCSLMRPARDRMAELFSLGSPVKTLSFPYVPNRTARITSEPSLVYELLVDQVDHPVMWKQSMTTLLEQGFDASVEFGPGKVLQGLMKRIAQPLGKTVVMTGVSDTATLRTFETTSRV